MRVLVFNCGSSSLKYRVIQMPEEIELAGGEAQRVGPPTEEPSCIFARRDGEEERIEVPMPDHASAFIEIMKILDADAELAPDAYGHRVVHGGTYFREATIIDDEALSRLEKISRLAPIHNPPAIGLIRAIREHDPSRPQIAVFDTAFHATIPSYAYTYALPAQLREEWGYRKYGFHGTSHRFVAQEAASMLGTPMESLNAVSCHLGSGGASLCAIRDGQSVDNTMGYSPLQGLIMSTRSGDLDPALTVELLAREMGEADEVDRMLNRESGILGLTGVSGDIRDVVSDLRTADSDRFEERDRVLQTYLWRIRKYIGAYLAILGAADALIFTDTIGENVPSIRADLCADLGFFGVEVDAALNRLNFLPSDIASAHSRVRVLVIPTNEELAIGREVHATLLAATPEGVRP